MPDQPAPTWPWQRWGPAPVIAIAAVVLAVVFGSLGYVVGQVRQGPQRPGSAAPPGGADQARCASGEQTKRPLRGLLTVGNPPDGWADVLGGWSVNVNWADLQPEPGAPIVRPNAVDEAIAALRDLDPSCARGLKLRVFAGIGSPDWAKALGGGPLEMTLPQENRPGSVPRFWTPEFGRAYQDLQSQLAALYDGEPLIREVAISRCATFYAEPLLRQTGLDSNLATLQQAGWTPAKDQRCLEEQIDTHRSWRRTPSSLALNPYQVDIGFGIGMDPDLRVPALIGARCREVLGQRCILGNNSIRTPVASPAYDELYAMLKQLGPPLQFQTAGPQRIGDPVATVRRARRLGAGSVEIAPPLLGQYPQLRTLARQWGQPQSP